MLSNDEEIWMKVIAFPKYSVSSKGRVRKDASKSSHKELEHLENGKTRMRTRYFQNKERILKVQKNSYVTLWHNGIGYFKNISVLRDKHFGME